jgi:hypothetical protein
MFSTAPFTIAKLWKQPRCPQWIKKIWHIHKMEYYSAIRNNAMWFEGKWMQLEDIMLSEVSQAQKHNGFIDPKDKHIHRNKHDHTQKLRCRT